VGPEILRGGFWVPRGIKARISQMVSSDASLGMRLLPLALGVTVTARGLGRSGRCYRSLDFAAQTGEIT
jgi:hypothetical protein